MGPVLSCPFATVGTIATGNTAECGTALTVTRSSAATYVDGNGTLQTASANNLRVVSTGALFEPTVTNYALWAEKWNSGASAVSPWTASNVTLGDGDSWLGHSTATRITATDGSGRSISQSYPQGGNAFGWGSVWAKATSGTQSVSVCLRAVGSSTTPTCTGTRADSGTVTTVTEVSGCCARTTVGTTWVQIGLSPGMMTGASTYVLAIAPCTITDGPSAMTGTSCGTADFAGAQASISTSFFGTFIDTAGTAATREADVVTIANPFDVTEPAAWCVGTTRKAYFPTWDDNSSALWTFLSSGTDAAANSWRLFSRNGMLQLSLYGSAGTERLGQWTHGYALDSTHTFRAGTFNGTYSLFSDSLPATFNMSGTGTGTIPNQNATLRIGSGTTTNSPQTGYLKNVKLWNVACSKAR